MTYMKNCEPLVPGPRFAIDSRNGLSCLTVKFSSETEYDIRNAIEEYFAQFEYFTFERSPVNWFATSAISSREITRLYHKILDNTMENNPFVVQRFVRSLADSFNFARAQCAEIFHRFRCYVRVQLEHDTSGWQSAQRNIEIRSLTHFRSSAGRIAGIAFIAFIGHHRHIINCWKAE